MDFGMFLGIVFVVALLVSAIFLKTPSGKGRAGERQVERIIGPTKAGEQYVINDLRIRTEDGKTSQVDHVVIRSNGLFVIETKNYSGRIYGNENQMEWTQVLQYGKLKHKFYNPLRQNKTHIYRIGQVIGHAVPLVSAVVFVQGNTEYIQAPDVYSLLDLKKMLRTTYSCRISPEQMEHLYNLLMKENESAHLSTAEHVSHIREMKQQVQEGICPRCGAKLVQRHHNDSVFWGCSKYPECRFTKK